jgi:olefin beta-lactone synthetase
MNYGSYDICTSLRELAAQRPSMPAVISPSGVLTASELNGLSDRCAAGLVRAGIGKGTRTVLMVIPGLEFMVLTFALVKAGAVLVVVDPGIGWDNLKRCLGEARPEAFVGITRAHLGRLIFGWSRSSIRTCVSVGQFRLPGWISYRSLIDNAPSPTEVSLPERDPDQPAAIVFTSGSTGTPKGVVYTHRMFSAQAGLLQQHFQIGPGEVDLATFPLFALYDPAMKVTTVFPDMDFTRPGQADPAIIAETINRYGVTHMFGSPALLDRFGRFGQKRGIRFPRLKRVLSAGAPVPNEVLDRLQGMLEGPAQVYTPYGATEALPVCSISADERASESGVGRGVCVGRPLPGVGVAVIRITEEPLAEWSDQLLVEQGQVGELIVWGDNVSRSYWAHPQADRFAKIGGETEVRHRMGDLGFVDGQGRIWFCGRKSHRVRTAAGDLFTIPCESVFNQHPAVFRTALVGVRPAPQQRPVLCVELEAEALYPDQEAIRRELLELGATHPATSSIRDILFHPSFPVDARHNAKIFREKLAVWAEARLRNR